MGVAYDPSIAEIIRSLITHTPYVKHTPTYT